MGALAAGFRQGNRRQRAFPATEEEMQAALQTPKWRICCLDKSSVKARAAWTLPHRRREMLAKSKRPTVLLRELAGIVGRDVFSRSNGSITLGMNLLTDEDVMRA